MAREVDVTIKGKNEAGPAFKQAAADAESFRGGIEKMLNPLEALKGAIAALGLTALGEFFKSTVEAAAQAEGAWGRVSAALANVGISADLARPDLERLFKQLEETTRFSETEAKGAFATLLTITGDYASSVQNMTLVADVAAAKQISLGDAADLVGRVMAGTGARGLKQFGITTTDVGEAMQQLRDKTRGFAEKDADTLDGSLHKLANAWEHLKEELGGAITGADSARSGNVALVDSLKQLSDWIDANQDGIHTLTDFFASAASFFALKPLAGVVEGYGKLAVGVKKVLGLDDDTVDTSGAVTHDQEMAFVNNRRKLAAEAAANARAVAAKQRHEAEEQAKKDRDARLEGLTKEAATLGDLRKAGLLTTADVGKALQTIHDLEAALASGTLTDAQRGSLAKAAKDARDALALVDSSSVAGPHTALRSGATAFDIVGRPKTVSAAAAPNVVQDSVGHAFQQTIRDATKAGQAVDTLNEKIGQGAADAALSFSSTWGAAIGDVIEGHKALGAAILSTGRKAIGGVLAAEGQATMLKAAEALAEGITNPVKLLQAAKLFGVGTLELAAASSLSGGGGGGGFSGGLSSGGIAQTQNDLANTGKVTVYMPGTTSVINMNDPDTRADLIDAFKQLANGRDIDIVVGDQGP